jgi:hypothetical protein
MDGDGRQGDANPIANREKLRKNNTTASRRIDTTTYFIEEKKPIVY